MMEWRDDVPQYITDIELLDGPQKGSIFFPHNMFFAGPPSTITINGDRYKRCTAHLKPNLYHYVPPGLWSKVKAWLAMGR